MALGTAPKERGAARHPVCSPRAPRSSRTLPVVVAAAAEPAVLLLLLQAGPGGAAQVFALLFGLLQDTFVGQRAQPAQQLSIHLQDEKERRKGFGLASCPQAKYREEAPSGKGAEELGD